MSFEVKISKETGEIQPGHEWTARREMNFSYRLNLAL